MRVYVGPLQQRAPKQYPGIGWWHVVNDAYGTLGNAPVHVALDQDTLQLGGGDPLWPGDAWTTYSDDGIWLAGPKQGPLAKVSIEIRPRQTFIYRDSFGPLQATTVAKVEDFVLTPRIWQNISSGIIATYAIAIRPSGGPVWVGTHMSTKNQDGSSRPPEDLPDGSGKSWRVDDGETLPLKGNPYLWAWADRPGVRIDFLKSERGWTFGGY